MNPNFAISLADLGSLAPELILTAVATLLLLLEAFAPAWRRAFVPLGLAGTVAAAWALADQATGSTFHALVEATPLTRAFAIGSAIAADGIGTGVAGTTVAILSRFGQRIGVKVSESAPALLAEAPAIAEEVAAAKTLFDANLGDIAPKLVTPRFLDLAANPNLTRVVYGRALELWVNLATTLGRQGTYLAGANQPDWTITLQGQLVRIDLTTFQALGPHLARGMYQANQPFMIFMYEVPAL